MSNLKSVEYESDSNNRIDKYTNYMITSQIHHTPPYEWSEGIFQGHQPISGKFLIGNNFSGNMQCVNNQTGRAYSANPCGYWNNTGDQFNSGKTLQNNNKLNMNGTLFPIGEISDDIMVTPNDRVVFGYTRIGEEIRNR